MKDSAYIINLFNKKDLKRLCIIDEIITMIDVFKFPMYFKNMIMIHG